MAGLPAFLGPCALLFVPSVDISFLLSNPTSGSTRKSTEIQTQVEGDFEGASGGHRCPQSHMQMYIGVRVVAEYSLMKIEASLGNVRWLGIEN